MTLAVGENALQFEHRDLHWGMNIFYLFFYKIICTNFLFISNYICKGNILVQETKELHLMYYLNGKQLIVPSKGIKTTIIDYTLSRLTYGNNILYNDLSTDEELFLAQGDYQFDIYRMMRDLLK